MPALCGSMIVGRMPLFEGRRLHHDHGRWHRHRRHRPDPRRRAAAGQGIPGIREADQGSQKAIWNDLGFDPYRTDVYDDPGRCSSPTTCFSGEVTFDYHQGELGNVAPEYTGPLYPGGPDVHARS